MIRVGILSFSDGRERVHESLRGYIASCQAQLKTALESTSEVLTLEVPKQISSNVLVKEMVTQMLQQRPDACILNIPVFAFPNFASIAAQLLRRIPLLAVSPVNGLYPGLGGLQAAVGMIRQTGGQCEKVWGNIETRQVLDRVMAFLRGAHAVSVLQGQVFGLFGGRSIGMGTGTASPDVWLDKFGVDIEHIDQLEIERRAKLVPMDKTAYALAWLQEKMGAIEYDGIKLTTETLARQVNCHIAIKEIIQERGLSFVGVKCHYEMSEYHVTQCLSAALCNDPYDWDGVKEPIVFACEADADAALSMQVLKLISSKPVVFMDFRHFMQEDGLFAFCNCGACATWYAGQSDRPEDNLKHVTLCPVIPKYGGGGCHIRFIAAEGPMTFARLTHRMDKYILQAFEGEFRKLPQERLKETCPSWPHGYAAVKSDPMLLLEKFSSNHIHAVSGQYIKELEAFCSLAQIDMEVL